MGKRRGDMTKDDYIRREIKRLGKFFENLPPDKTGVAQELIKNAAFMAVSLQELQQIINEKGYTEEYQNGENQSGIKKLSEVDIYNTTMKNYLATMKQLLELIDNTSSSVPGRNAALDYISGRGVP